VVMVNLSGVAAFWLRCQTSLFDEAGLERVDLKSDRTPFFGVGSRGRYRLSGTGEWQSLSTQIVAGPRRNVVLDIDFGADCRIDDVRWTVPEIALSRAEVTLVTTTGDRQPGAAHYDRDRGVLRTSSVKPLVRGMSISLGPSLYDIGGFSILGANLSAPALLQSPKTAVPEKPYWYLLYVWNLAALVGLAFAGAYRITRSLEILDDFWLAMKAVGLATMGVIVILFLYRGYQEATYAGFEYSRLVVIIGATFATILLTGNRAIVDAIHSAFLRRGYGIRKVVVVGAGPVGQHIVDRLRKHYWLAYEPVAFVDDNPATHGEKIQGIDVMGGTEALPSVARAVGTSEVIVALPNSSHKSVRDIVGRCQSENLKFHILPDLFEVISSDVKVGAMDGVPVLDLDDHYLGHWDRLLKRALDVSAVLIGGVVLLPLWATIAALIKIGSRGPVLFTQARVGEHGKTFSFIKFRTMQVVSEAEEKREREAAYAELIESGKDAGGKIVNSNRVTWIGGLLRRYRLDELPQVLNVLLGEMSLVGPRPPIPYEIEHYNSWHLERLKGTPGITGLWQVSGGPDLAFEEMVKLDIYYLKNWSLWMDFKILLKTLPVVLSGRGE